LTKGTYQVKVTAKNKCGLTDTETETITVQDGMKLNPSSDIESEKITEDTAIFLLESNGAEFTWNFGKNDIVKTDVGYIKHGFSSVGNKNISVFVKTACGDTATFYTQMTINKLSTGDDVTSGIKDVQEARFTIYPNPNQGIFQISGLPIGSYKIMNLMGAEVYRFRVENTDIQTLNLEQLAKGVYQVASEDIKIIHNKVVITD
jgi:PKD repeat protein